MRKTVQDIDTILRSVEFDADKLAQSTHKAFERINSELNRWAQTSLFTCFGTALNAGTLSVVNQNNISNKLAVIVIDNPYHSFRSCRITKAKLCDDVVL